MNKYIDADLLRKEIEKERKNIDGLFTEGDNSFYDGQDDAYNHTLALINSLQQEQQEVNLEKEIDACWQNWLSPSNQKEAEGVLPKTEFAMYARHFYELGKNSK